MIHPLNYMGKIYIYSGRKKSSKKIGLAFKKKKNSQILCNITVSYVFNRTDLQDYSNTSTCYRSS